MNWLDKLKRRVRNLDISNVGAFACGIYIILRIAGIILLVVQNKVFGDSMTQQDFLYTLINFIIDVLFYLFLASTFMKAKANFFFAFRAMLILIICNYILPLIMNFIQMSLGGGILEGLIFLVFGTLSSIFAILFYVFMILENKNHKKNYWITLVVLGAIIVITSLVSSTYLFTMECLNMQDFVMDSPAIGLTITQSIVSLISTVVSFLFSILFLLYAIDIKRRRDF